MKTRALGSTAAVVLCVWAASLGGCRSDAAAGASERDAASGAAGAAAPSGDGAGGPAVTADGPTDAGRDGPATTVDAPGYSEGGAAGSSSDGGAPGSSEAGGAADAADDRGAVANADGGAPVWPAVPNYGVAGPFAVTRDTNTGPGGAYDVFRPATLGAENRRHPVVSWANGTLFPLANYQKLLEHWASHGFVVIAGHTNTTAGGGTHKAAIDWIRAENARAGSPYFGVLDPAHVAAAGHSQGGGATIAAGAQKPAPLALTTTLPLMPILSFETDTSIVGKQTAPMFNINATMDNRDPTGAVATQIDTAAKTELVQAAFIGVHEDAMTPAMFAPTLAWLRFKLMGDAAARAMFYPPATCGLCRDAAWKQVRYQNTPTAP